MMPWIARLLIAIRCAAAPVVKRWRWVSLWPAPRRVRIVRTDEEPEKLRSHALYVIEDSGHQWAAVMTCPGGCGQALHMNLLPDSKPVWRLTEHPDGTASLSPSVWRREGCGCHFWLKKGRIEWCMNNAVVPTRV